MTDTTSIVTSELRKLLETTKVSDIDIPAKKPVEVDVSMTPEQAATVLWKHSVLGAPVWDASTNSYCGIFDMRDLLSTVVASHKHNEDDRKSFTKWLSKGLSHFQEFSQTKAVKQGGYTVSYLAARNPFQPLTEEDTLGQAFELCAGRHYHNIPIVDKNSGRCVQFLSQSTLVKYLADHFPANKALETFLNQSIAKSGLPYKKDVVSCPDTATASEVFEVMDSNRLSGIAIVSSEDGALIANTSASDIKMAVKLGDDSDEMIVADLEINILSYLSVVYQSKRATETRHPSSRVRESSTLGHTLRLLAATGYHRVFVVDEFLKPVGVVSVADIVAFMMEQAKE